MNLDELPLNEKLEKLIELRKEEDEIYNKFLTLVDEQGNFALPHELSGRLIEIKDTLNKSFDITQTAFRRVQEEDQLFWKDVANKTADYLTPLAEQQREFNATLVHLLNELISSTTESLNQIRRFHNTLILYFQRIIPLLDTRMREFAAVHERIREYSELIFEKFDQQIQTLQIESESVRVSTRELSHLANLLQTAAAEGREIAKPEITYYHFEENFRGSREEIKERMKMYLKFFGAVDGPVIDLGCGRGEFLELLQENSIDGIGVDSNAKMVASCRERGLKAEQDDLLAYIRGRSENSLGGVFSSQVVEHLPPDYIMNLLAAAHTRLKPGAAIVLETVNIASAYAFLELYTKDLTHKTPLHPETLNFLLRSCGFQKTHLMFSSPVPAPMQLRLVPAETGPETEAFNENMRKLNKLLFNDQDYAAIGYK